MAALKGNIVSWHDPTSRIPLSSPISELHLRIDVVPPLDQPHFKMLRSIAGLKESGRGKRGQVLSFRFRVSGFRFSVLRFGSRISGFEIQVLGFWFLVSSFRFEIQVLGFWFRGGGNVVHADDLEVKIVAASHGIRHLVQV